jgi:rhodanese-related sulfurtransferase
MAKSVKDLVEAANAVVPRITPAQAKELIEAGNAVVVDVRDAPEVDKSGKVAGAVHIPRGMLEFRADPESPYYDQNFANDPDVAWVQRLGTGRRGDRQAMRLENATGPAPIARGPSFEWTGSRCSPQDCGAVR